MLSCSFSPSSGPETHEPAHPSILPVCVCACVDRAKIWTYSQKPQGVSTELSASHMVSRRECCLPSRRRCKKTPRDHSFCVETKTIMLLLSRRNPELGRKDCQISSPLAIYAFTCTRIGLPWKGHVSRLGCVDQDQILGAMVYLASFY